MTNRFIRVIDNFLSPEREDFFHSIHIQNNFAWYFNQNTAGDDGIHGGGVLDTQQFCHLAYYNKPNSSIHTEYQTIIDELVRQSFLPSTYDLFRMKSNLTHQITDYRKNNYQPLHQDYTEENYYSILYYCHDADGDTFFFQNENTDSLVHTVSPKKGRAVIFDSQWWHAGSNPIISSYRIVINSIFRLDKPLQS